jgi:hypothetical protein
VWCGAEGPSRAEQQFGVKRHEPPTDNIYLFRVCDESCVEIFAGYARLLDIGTNNLMCNCVWVFLEASNDFLLFFILCT